MIDVNKTVQLLADLLGVTIGDNIRIDSRNISKATGDESAGTITLRFQDGERLEIPTKRFADVVETLETCGVTVVQ